MSGIQQGRAVSRKVFKKPKTFAKAEKMYEETFNENNKVGAKDREYAPMYSRVTNKIISKTKSK